MGNVKDNKTSAELSMENVKYDKTSAVINGKHEEEKNWHVLSMGN